MSRAKSFRPADAEALRSDALVRLESLATIQTMSRTQLLKLQSQFGFGAEWGRIEIPASFMPPGRHREHSRRVFDFRDIANGNDAAIAAVTKLMCLRWLVPVGQSSEPPSTSTLSGTLRELKRLLPLALAKPSEDPSKIWSRLKSSDLYSVLPVSANGTDFGAIFRSFKERGLLEDVVDISIDRGARRQERSRKGKPAPRKNRPQVAPFLHLPDRFVAECGWRCIWLVKSLAPTLIDLLASIFESQRLRMDVQSREAHKQFKQLVAERICNWTWLDAARRPIDSLPFTLFLRSRAGLKASEKSRLMAWPPQTLADLWALLALVQGANAFIVGISGGPRHGEILSQTRKILIESSQGFRLGGKTYKLIFNDAGADRDWPAPALAVAAVLQQVRLASCVRQAAKVYGYPREGEELWVRLPMHTVKDTGAPLGTLEVSIKNLVSAFGLQDALSGQTIRETNLHLHRLRKTTARIVGLTLTNAIQVLMDLFGHEDPEMTLRYLLSNQDIAEEARAVAEAQTIMFAVTAIEDAQKGGGGGASTLRDRVAEFAKLRGIEKLDAKSVDELARDLTENGQYWELVRPGVLCTKLPGQIGACNGKQGAPDSSRCKSTCQNRYEMAANLSGVDATIARILEHLQKALDEDEPMLAEQWRGQLVQNIFRFDSLREKWGQHPLVAEELARLASQKA